MERRLTTWGESRMYLNVIQTIQTPNLTADALLGKNVRSIHGKAHANAVSHQRDVSPSPLDLGLADGQDKVGLHHGVVHVESCAVQQLVLQEDNGVGVPDGCLQKTLAVLRVIGRDDLKPRAVSIPGSEALGMLSSDALGAAVGSPEHNWNVHLASRHVERLCC